MEANVDDDAVRERLAAALAQYPEAQEALRAALIAEGWLGDPDAEP